MRLLKTIAITAVLAANLAHAQTREITAKEMAELSAIDEKLAPSACAETKLYFEWLVIAGIGDAARAKDLEARMSTSKRLPEIEALTKRKTELLRGAQFPVTGHEAYFKSKARRDTFCPWRKLEVPYDLPPAQGAAQAREYALAIVPNFLVGWRLCEIYFPERRGQMEAAWAMSPLAKVELPEFKKVIGEVRAWLAQGIAAPAPGSTVDRGLKDPVQRSTELRQCDAMPANLKRIEKAFPGNWLAAHGRM